MKLKVFLTLMLVMGIFSAPSAPAATSRDDLLERINRLSDISQKQQKEIEALRRELKKQREGLAEAKEIQEEEVQKAVKAETKAMEKTVWDWLPDWAERIKIYGDLRLRYEGIYNRDQMQADRSSLDLPTRDRYRIRARLFFDGKVTDEITTQFMICTNQDGNLEATTTNQTLRDDFNDKGIYLHRAFASYKPKWLDGLEVTGGKFKNTFFHTDIMWDPDVNPEGIYERYQYKGWKDFQPYVHLAQMVLHELNGQTDDPALYIYQAGFDCKLGPVKWSLAGSYYDWSNLHNTRYLHLAQYKGGGGNTFYLDGTGTLQYRYDYNLVEGLSELKFKLGAVPAQVVFDYIVNTAKGIPSDQDKAFFVAFKVGKDRRKGDCSFFYKYARIEKDAVIGSMNDQDFYGANRKGHKVAFHYWLSNRIRFRTALFYTDPVSPWDPASPTFNNNDQNRMHETRLQSELVLNF